jgi:hypothetical protein
VSYKIAGIDIQKRMLAVVVADVSAEGEYDLSGDSSAAAPTNCGC